MNKEEFTDAFERGYWAALDAFGVYNNGTRYIGSPEQPIKEIFENRGQDEYYQIALDLAWEQYNENK